eukprot:gnl/MRDRNA2_/MRDRNA2_128275_c0_seq1.p1 gnl/MRDRNA2_/MRDRNA2_128275_c0~~gnl/MRDRNA2_/MRDRNA2_128275_c0_seq1.p1  ORF type:complete len:556 (+),score=116.31 gnl/MRDRNA2_/MRDRNA2_128275_c0_seq1:71-1738(+)
MPILTRQRTVEVVSGLTDKTTRYEVKKLFSKYGGIEAVYVFSAAQAKKKSLANVRFLMPDAALAAVQASRRGDMVLHGKVVDCQLYKENRRGSSSSSSSRSGSASRSRSRRKKVKLRGDELCNEEDVQNAVAAFVAENNLNTTTADRLERLPQVLQLKVLNGRWGDNLWNINAAVCAFITRIARENAYTSRMYGKYKEHSPSRSGSSRRGRRHQKSKYRSRRNARKSKRQSKEGIHGGKSPHETDDSDCSMPRKEDGYISQFDKRLKDFLTANRINEQVEQSLRALTSKAQVWVMDQGPIEDPAALQDTSSIIAKRIKRAQRIVFQPMIVVGDERKKPPPPPPVPQRPAPTEKDVQSSEVQCVQSESVKMSSSQDNPNQSSENTQSKRRHSLSPARHSTTNSEAKFSMEENCTKQSPEATKAQIDAPTQSKGSQKHDQMDVDEEKHTGQTSPAGKRSMAELGRVVKLTNLPQLSQFGVGSATKTADFIADLVAPMIADLPDNDASKGKAVVKSWADVDDEQAMFMELQGHKLAESTARVLDGLDLFGNKVSAQIA